MRPDVLRKKRQGSIGTWYFRRTFPRVLPGRRLWVSIVDGTWAGYFVIEEVHPETHEIVWSPSSWIERETRWIPGEMNSFRNAYEDIFYRRTPSWTYRFEYATRVPHEDETPGGIPVP